MVSIFNDDFRDFIGALNGAGVRYMLLGGYAVILHGYDRTTGDMDVWVERTPENYQRLAAAFSAFGMPTFDMTADNFLDSSRMDVVSFGVPPTSIEILTNPMGVDSANRYPRSIWYEHEGLSIRLIARDDLTAERAVGRPRDLDDIGRLET